MSSKKCAREFISPAISEAEVVELKAPANCMWCLRHTPSSGDVHQLILSLYINLKVQYFPAQLLPSSSYSQMFSL